MRRTPAPAAFWKRCSSGGDRHESGQCYFDQVEGHEDEDALRQGRREALVASRQATDGYGVGDEVPTPGTEDNPQPARELGEDRHAGAPLPF